MKAIRVFAMALLPVFSSGYAQSATAASGTGPFVVPTASAYEDLTRLAKQIETENAPYFSGATVIVYDQQAFSMLAMYPGSVRQLQAQMSALCDVAFPDVIHAEATSDVLSGAGAAASGLGALITAITPAYAIQGQAFAIDNNALIAAFANTMGQKVVIPAYLSGAAPASGINCGNFDKSASFASLWDAAAAVVPLVKAKLKAASSDDAKKAIQAVLDSYQNVRDGYLSTDKGNSLYSKITVAEAFSTLLKNANKPVVIDMKLDAAGIDSTTRTVLFWKSTKYSDNLLAHYFVFSLDKGVQLVHGNTAVTTTLNKNVNSFGAQSKSSKGQKDGDAGAFSTTAAARK